LSEEQESLGSGFSSFSTDVRRTTEEFPSMSHLETGEQVPHHRTFVASMMAALGGAARSLTLAALVLIAGQAMAQDSSGIAPGLGAEVDKTTAAAKAEPVVAKDHAPAAAAADAGFADTGGYSDAPASTDGFGDSDSGDGGGGAGGSKIICTAMNQTYGFGSFRNAIWIAYSDKHLTKAHEVGYHAIFLPLVDFGFKRGDGKLNMAVRRVMEWGTRHRSTDLRAEMRGTKRDTTGRVIRMIFEPLCYAVGKLKGY
jgi:hypothetical protein